MAELLDNLSPEKARKIFVSAAVGFLQDNQDINARDVQYNLMIAQTLPFLEDNKISFKGRLYEFVLRDGYVEDDQNNFEVIQK